MNDFPLQMEEDDMTKEYQTQKIYIKKLEETSQTELLEGELRHYFLDFGQIIDVKTLRNGELSS